MMHVIINQVCVPSSDEAPPLVHFVLDLEKNIRINKIHCKLETAAIMQNALGCKLRT